MIDVYNYFLVEVHITCFININEGRYHTNKSTDLYWISLRNFLNYIVYFIAGVSQTDMATHIETRDEPFLKMAIIILFNRKSVCIDYDS